MIDRDIGQPQKDLGVICGVAKVPYDRGARAWVAVGGDRIRKKINALEYAEKLNHAILRASHATH